MPVATHPAGLAAPVAVRYQDSHPRIAPRFTDLWNAGANIANGVFAAACPSLRPEHAEPGLQAIEAEIAHLRSTGANDVILEALTQARNNVVIWVDNARKAAA
jgi:hypothetical protein